MPGWMSTQVRAPRLAGYGNKQPFISSSPTEKKASLRDIRGVGRLLAMLLCYTNNLIVIGKAGRPALPVPLLARRSLPP